jgi:putative acetyltransferase
MKPDQITTIRTASREMVRQFGLLNNRFSNIGSTSQCHALVELDTQGVLTLNQLTDILNLEKSTTSRLITELLKKNLCQIQQDQNDRRNKLISLTKKGIALAEQIHFEANLQVENALAQMSEDERHTVITGLTIYAKALKRSQIKNTYTIRKLSKKDLPQLINLIKTVWAEFGFDSQHPAAPNFESELNQTYETYSNKKCNYFLLTQDNKIVGGAGYTPLQHSEKNICEFKGMYLSAKLRGQGLGTLLSEKVLLAAHKDGFTKSYIETMDYMHNANALYKKLGFKPLDKPIGNTGHTFTTCWYLKDLTNEEK